MDKGKKRTPDVSSYSRHKVLLSRYVIFASASYVILSSSADPTLGARHGWRDNWSARACKPSQEKGWAVSLPIASVITAGAAIKPANPNIVWRRVTMPSQSPRSEEHTSELQSLMRISYAVFCLKKKKET